MHITQKDLQYLPDEWLEELAEQFDPDGDYLRDGYSPRRIIVENWNAAQSELEDMLSSTLTGTTEEICNHV